MSTFVDSALSLVMSLHCTVIFEVVKQPIDLSTMNVKLEQGLYKDRGAFEADFRLMLKNCQLYNPVGTYAHNEAIHLDAFFEKT